MSEPTCPQCGHAAALHHRVGCVHRDPAYGFCRCDLTGAKVDRLLNPPPTTLTFTPAEGRVWAEFLAMDQRVPALTDLRARILAAMGGEES